ncbi:MAG: hypothetical protein AAF762_00225 [Pseudomonadota bacterium]
MAEMTPRQRALLERARARRQKAAPEPAPSQSMMGGVFDAFTQGASLGWGDELTALEAGLLGKTPKGGWLDYSGTFGDRYNAALFAERGQQEEFREEHPVASVGAELAGGLATGAGAARGGLTLMGRGGGVGRNVALGAGEGGLYGAAYGAGASEGSRLVGALMVAGTGAAAGGVLTAGGATLAKALQNNAAAKATPSSREMMGRGGALLEHAKQANPRFAGFDEYVSQVYRTLPEEGFDPVMHPALARWVDQLEELSTGGTAPTYQQLDMLRKRLATAASSFNNPEQQRLAVMARRALDSFMERATPAGSAGLPATMDDVARMQAGDDAASAVADAREGRELYRRGKNLKRLEDARYAAELHTETSGVGGNIDNNVRRQIKQILLSPKQRARFNADELRELDNAVRSGLTERTMRLLGRLGVQGNGLGMAGGAAAGTAAFMSGNPLFMAPSAVGSVARALADRTATSKVAALGPIIASGGKVSPLTDPVRLSAPHRALIDALAAQSGGAFATTP